MGSSSLRQIRWWSASQARARGGRCGTLLSACRATITKCKDHELQPDRAHSAPAAALLRDARRLLREYLDAETRVPELPFAHDLERAIDDFVLLCILVGNDFLPHSPTLDIAEGAMDELFAGYREMLPRLGGYLTSGGRIDHGRLEAYLFHLAENELDTLVQRAKVRRRRRAVCACSLCMFDPRA